MATNSVLAKLAVQISANTAQFNQALSKTQNNLSSFTSGVSKVAGALGVAFGIQQIASFSLEISKLSGQAQAVNNAFKRLPESTKLMSELKDATGGTVSELELMKRAVQASNFDISLSALPRLLEFATLRAQQTGQSVDYLVDSIVTGIGRKSKLILDNLGISAVALDKALGGASVAAASVGQVAEAVGKIAEENLKNMEGFAENASTKLERLAASWENVKVAAGDAANNTGFLGKTINMWTKFMDALSGDEFTTGFNQLTASGGRASEILERFAAAGGKIDLTWQQLLERGFVRTEAAAKKYEKILAEIAEKQKNLALIPKVEIDPATGLPTSGGTKWDPSLAEKHITSLNSLKEKEKELLNLFGATDEADKKKLQNTAAQILAIRSQIKAIEDLIRVEKEKKPAGLKLQFIPDLEAEGSLNPELRNDQARNQALEFSDALLQVGTSAEFAGGAVIHLQEATGEFVEKLRETIDIAPLIAGSIIGIAQSFGEIITGTSAEYEQAKAKLDSLTKGTAEYQEALENVARLKPRFGDTVLQALGEFAQAFGAILIATGIGEIALDKFSGPEMIAAGFVLTAAGTALTNSLRGPSISGGGGGGSSRGIDRFIASTSVQNTSPQLVTVLKGEDMWIMLQNYQSGKRYTSG